MDVVYGLIPMMLIFGGLVVGVFIWMAKTGHFDDLDGAAHTIFMDDEIDAKPRQPEAEDLKAEVDKAADPEQKPAQSAVKASQD